MMDLSFWIRKSKKKKKKSSIVKLILFSIPNISVEMIAELSKLEDLDFELVCTDSRG